MKNKLFLSIVFSTFLVSSVKTSVVFDNISYCKEDQKESHCYFDVFKEDMIEYFDIDINYIRNNCRFFRYVSNEMILEKIIFSIKELAYYVIGKYNGDIINCKGLWLVRYDTSLLVLLMKYIGADKIRKDRFLIQYNLKKMLLQTESDQENGRKCVEDFLFNNDEENIRICLRYLNINSKDINDIMKVFHISM